MAAKLDKECHWEWFHHGPSSKSIPKQPVWFTTGMPFALVDSIAIEALYQESVSTEHRDLVDHRINTAKVIRMDFNTMHYFILDAPGYTETYALERIWMDDESLWNRRLEARLAEQRQLEKEQRAATMARLDAEPHEKNTAIAMPYVEQPPEPPPTRSCVLL
jgi:hypothetical protein